MLVTAVYRGITNLFNFEMDWENFSTAEWEQFWILFTIDAINLQMTHLSIFPWCSLEILDSKMQQFYLNSDLSSICKFYQLWIAQE